MLNYNYTQERRPSTPTIRIRNSLFRILFVTAYLTAQEISSPGNFVATIFPRKFPRTLKIHIEQPNFLGKIVAPRKFCRGVDVTNFDQSFTGLWNTEVLILKTCYNVKLHCWLLKQSPKPLAVISCPSAPAQTPRQNFLAAIFS